MAFNHLAGITTPGAPDEIIDWFTTFEAWMLTLGWTVAAGAGSQDIYFQSVGEAGGLTMLFIHVWRHLINVNRVHLEVTDDTTPTHTTNEGGYVDSGGVQFAFWLTGDMDAIIVNFKLGAGYREVYAGMVIPFALTIPDETYRMIATSTIFAGSILRDFNNVWDVDHNILDSASLDNAGIDPLAGSVPLIGCFFNTDTDIAGQLIHMSARIFDPGVSAEDTIETGYPGATTTWIALEDSGGSVHAVRTGGVLPIGVPDGSFAHAAGVAANAAALWAAVSALAVGIGWTDLGDPGYGPPGQTGILLYSTGETGLEDIYAGFSWADVALGRFYAHVSDDAILTNCYQALENELNAADFPINYWLTGDKDCLIVVFQRAIGYCLQWAGLATTFSPSLIGQTEYSACVFLNGWSSWAAGVLRDHQDNWVQTINEEWDGGFALNSNPNSFDGVTYLVWPIHCQRVAAPNYPIGQFKYIGFTSGGGVASMDTITIGGQVYTVFFPPAGNPNPAFCLRTV